ncbi:glycosyltransferase family 2 protein [Roseinatronobacter sp.]|uniref:glycosyltransferase family 2 protein n=1 Tax=Roseinatronobacter sp. TaxID=1945755 RepID=UPI0025CF7414|nr:glycosyltransferase family 2 protein [Rhodobaca sp.]
MTDIPRVSVIIPTFNRHMYLADAIRSLLDQTSRPVDIVVVDDGSTDGTSGIEAEFAPHITYIRQDNAGRRTAIATGLKQCRGELVWIMDDDDTAAPHALERLSAPFRDNPELVLSYGKTSRGEKPGLNKPENIIEYPDDPRPFLVQMMEDCFIAGPPCVLARRDALMRMLPLDRSIISSVDYYLSLGLAMQGPAAFVDSVVLRQRQHPGQRGPKGGRHAEAEWGTNWIYHDTYLLKQVIADLPLQAYLNTPPWNDRALSPEQQRIALIQKAVIAGRKKLWPEATEALHQALGIMPDTALGVDETQVLAGMLGCRYGIAEVHQRAEILHGLRAACAARRDKTRILVALSRPLLHEFGLARRDRDVARAAQAIRSWSRLMGIPATWFAFQSAFGRNLARMATRLRAG